MLRASGPDVIGESKRRGVPEWRCEGMICTGESSQKVIKITFAKGASLEDPAGLYNASLVGHARRAIDDHEGDAVDDRARGADPCGDRSHSILDPGRGAERKVRECTPSEE